MLLIHPPEHSRCRFPIRLILVEYDISLAPHSAAHKRASLVVPIAHDVPEAAIPGSSMSGSVPYEGFKILLPKIVGF